MDETTLNFRIIGTAKELFEAWFDVKKKLGSHVVAAGKNPHFGNDYIMLDSLINKIDKACIDYDLGIMQFPTGEVDHVAIAIFPDEVEYLVVLYASMKALQHKMTNEVANEDSGLYALYSDRYAKLSADYQRGIAALRGNK